MIKSAARRIKVQPGLFVQSQIIGFINRGDVTKIFESLSDDEVHKLDEEMNMKGG